VSFCGGGSVAGFVQKAGPLKGAGRGGWHNNSQHKESRRKDEGMMGARKIRQYLPALLLYIQRRVSGERGVVVAVRTRDICGMDRRCGRAVYSLMMRLAEKGLARRFKKGTYLIERRAVEEVLTALKEWI
jgi:hypothetical protein